MGVCTCADFVEPCRTLLSEFDERFCLQKALLKCKIYVNQIKNYRNILHETKKGCSNAKKYEEGSSRLFAVYR